MATGKKTTLRVVRDTVGHFAVGDTFTAEDYGTDVDALVKAGMVEIVEDESAPPSAKSK